ncbi:MAG TPA: substrate-binding domain-containing protein [Methylomirabilota bacterium]|nr:substrate-binding domain-containing protein [Methylomirabilota bacterium]
MTKFTKTPILYVEVQPKLLTVPEAARYLRLNPRSVYLLAQRGAIPGTRVTGKWLFPERLLGEWLESNARRGKADSAAPADAVSRVFLAGSDDPALDLLAEILAAQPEAPMLFAARVGSVAGLEAVAAGHADVACVHLVDPDSGEYNGSGLGRYIEPRPSALVNLFHRDLGLVVPKGNPRDLASLPDLARPGLRFVNRQPGSGTRHFVDLVLSRAGVEPERVAGYDDAVSTHWAIALRVLRRKADAGVAARSVAQALDLGFVPLVRERFDMVIPKDTFFRPAVQALVEAVRSDGFREGLDRLGGYDSHQSGRVLAEVS